MATMPIDRSRQALEISNALTHNHRLQFGRGAGSVKTVISGNFVVTFLEDIYTTNEKSLIDGDEHELVFATRFALQKLARAEYVRIIEEATGRTVRAFLSQNHIGPDIAAEMFVLEPEAGEIVVAVD
jgi:uncharacterized protein YbcI